MNTVAMEQRKKIHPHKFTLWVAIGSMVMMFAGLTSAYVVKRNQADWLTFELPAQFFISTVVILISSATMFFALKAFKGREMKKYRLLIFLTTVLGIAFLILQTIGIYKFQNSGTKMIGFGSKPSFSCLFVIALMHAAHVIGGVVTLIVISLRSFSSKIRSYSAVPVELINTYWHFVDLLWLYLLIFLLMIR